MSFDNPCLAHLHIAVMDILAYVNACFASFSVVELPEYLIVTALATKRVFRLFCSR